jgi:hypothetical protein
MDADLSAVYAQRGRPSIPPGCLLRALVVQILYTVRSERQLVEQIDFNLLFRWFVGLSIDDRVWDHSTFSHNRERLFDEGMARKFFEQVRLTGPKRPISRPVRASGRCGVSSQPVRRSASWMCMRWSGTVVVKKDVRKVRPLFACCRPWSSGVVPG